MTNRLRTCQAGAANEGLLELAACQAVPMHARSLVIASVAGYLVLVAGLMGLIFAHSVIAVGIPAIAVQVLGLALMVWARLTFRARSFHFAANPTEGGLVTTGPYRFVRHPIYSAILVAAVPAVLTHLSWQNVVFGTVMLLGIAIRIAAEERLVTERYPEYVEYAKRTKRLVPFVI